MGGLESLAALSAWDRVFYALLIVTATIVYIGRPSSGSNKQIDTPEVSHLRRSYLCVWFLAAFADWLQGPYFWAVYDQYGYKPAQISMLFVAGFASGTLLGTPLGSMADSYGRKRLVMVFFFMYASACALIHVNNYKALFVGRIISGTASSLLHTCFDSWLIAEFEKIKKRQPSLNSEVLSSMRNTASFGSSVLAIAAGSVAQWIVNFSGEMASYSPSFLQGIPGFGTISYAGELAPFELSLAVLIAGLLACSFLWNENRGSQSKTNGQTSSGISAALRVILFSNGKFSPMNSVCLLGLVSALYESAMYTFVNAWVPGLKAVARGPPPLGTVFSCYMCACMVGSVVYGALKRGMSVAMITVVTCVFAGLCLLISSEAELGGDMAIWVRFVCFVGFEMTVNMYFPAMFMMKSSVVPSESRTAVYSVYRVPLNLAVICVLMSDLPVKGSLQAASAMLFGAAILQLVIYYQTENKTKKD